MDREKEREYTISGFLFGSKEDVETANQELSAIQYIDKKIENKNGEIILSVYNAALEKRLFRTPIGYSYLHELQKRMLKQGILKEQIPAIPLYQVFNNDYQEMIKPVRVVKRIKKKDEAKEKLRYSVIANVILISLVLILFIISFTGSNPNILNYRQTIENEYSQWEQELIDREQVIRQKEKNINIIANDNATETQDIK